MEESRAAWQFPGSGAGRRILCVDFDGTITAFDVLFTLLQRHARPGWDALEERWRAGEMTSLECMRAQVGLLPLPRPAILDFFDQVPVDPDFPRFVERARRLGFELLVLSDGLDLYIHRILARHGIHGLEVLCNRAELDEEGAFEITAPYPPECADEAGNAKGHHVRVLRERFDHVTLIGDGYSDRGAARAAHLTCAKGELREWCERNRVPHRPFDGFADLLARLPESDGILFPWRGPPRPLPGP